MEMGTKHDPSGSFPWKTKTKHDPAGSFPWKTRTKHDSAGSFPWKTRTKHNPAGSLLKNIHHINKMILKVIKSIEKFVTEKITSQTDYLVI